MDMIQTTSIEIPIVPKDEQTSLSLSLNRILIAEQRGDEIAVVTRQKAPELLATFNRAYLEATETYSRVRLELARAEDAVNKAKASVLIDKLPGLLKEKGLASSADIRAALVEADSDYQAAKERADVIAAMVEYIKGKIKFLENAYTAVKKIMDTNSWDASYNLNGTGDETAPVGGQARRGQFGNPK